ncbi:hypothetical protein HDV00_006048 [Rhizophlyctis rosea]|nr:hypothetical protein HDV00_006048 [Rhizophlyctis rosea]
MVITFDPPDAIGATRFWQTLRPAGPDTVPTNPVLSSNAPALGYQIKDYTLQMDVPLLASTIPGFTGRARFGYRDDDIHATITSDPTEADRLFRTTFYDINGWRKHQTVGFDCEKRTVPGAADYGPWLQRFLQDEEIGKAGFGIQNDVQMLYNVGMQDLKGFVLGQPIPGADFGMERAAREFLGIPKIRDYGGGGFESEQLNETRIKYIVRDAQLSLECLREVNRLMTPQQRLHAQEFAALDSYHLTHRTFAPAVTTGARSTVLRRRREKAFGGEGNSGEK